jgi:lipid-A-disaccharide synthase-like uncharacterized protein
VEVIPAELHRDVKDRYDGKPVARLWVAQEQFRPLRVERWVGAGRDLVEPPRHEARADAAEGGPVLLDDALPTVLDLPVGPRSGQNSVSQPWRAGDFRDPTGRVVRQTVHEIVEKRGYWRERVLKVSLSDGAVACHQVWTPGRPWPESIRAWSGVEPRPPFVYETRLRVWSKRPYMAWLGTFFLIFGFAAQGLFTMRFVVQWIASERAGRSVIPMAFWYLSLSGGFMLLAYAVYRMDPVFIVGQSTGVLIYVRNVWFRLKERGAAAPKTDAGAPAEPAR